MKLDRQAVCGDGWKFEWYPTTLYLLRTMNRGDTAWLFRCVDEIEREHALSNEERALCFARLAQNAGEPIIFVRAA